MSRPPIHGWVARDLVGVRVVEARLGPPMLAPGDAPTLCLHVSGDPDGPEPWHWSATLSNLLLINDGRAFDEQSARTAATREAADWLRATLTALEAL